MKKNYIENNIVLHDENHLMKMLHIKLLRPISPFFQIINMFNVIALLGPQCAAGWIFFFHVHRKPCKATNVESTEHRVAIRELHGWT